MSEQEQQLEYKRHTLAHLLAATVLKLYPDAKPTIGPVIENGFYYDFAFSTVPSQEDLKKIEKQMRKTLGSWKEMTGEEVSAADAREKFADNPFKRELIDEIEAAGEKITLYSAGAENNRFTDLCRGGHSENPAADIDAKSFILNKLAGAYWRGDENREQLTRIYGVAFDTKDELDAYKTQMAEAEKRDHRKLGKELDLFTFSDLVGPGLPLFTPRGTLLRDTIIDKIHNLQKEFGYEKVTIPHITKKDLYEKSGHWEKFGDELFKVKGQSEQEFVMKPMNCPHHTQIYSAQPRSYKDLPIRYTETTMVYRDEQAGELLGLSRVRSITQDDGHVFCRQKQVKDEIGNIAEIIKKFYIFLGMFSSDTCWISVSVRDPETPGKYLGTHNEDGTVNSRWDEAESALKVIAKNLAKENNLKHDVVKGEATFYGPKLDFMFKDAIGREWQLATIQLDFIMPRRFNLQYTDENGNKKYPVMIHRAVAGSLERFLSVIIEHFAGAFPLWLSPVQAVVIPVSDKFSDYGQEVQKKLQEYGFRVELDNDSETLGKRIRQAQKQKVPYMLVVGEKEVAAKTVALRSREGDESTMSIDDLVEKLEAEVTGK